MPGILMLSSYIVNAQKYYAVMVSDSKTAAPLIGVSIKVISTGTAVNTSKSGNVVIIALPDDSIHVQFKGYKERKISLVNQSQAISIVLEALPKIVGIKPKKARS
jgi:hypothetical protein